MRYEGQIYRPFSEADSYLLQCTVGCSHNGCTFCGMYKDRSFRIRSLEEIREDIAMAVNYYGDVEKVFLCDGDAIAMETGLILDILGELYRSFPSLRHVGMYVGPHSTLQKGMEDLQTLRKAGFTKAYLGVESGDDEVLAAINKGVTADMMLRAGKSLVESGINLSAMVLLGIAGRGEKSRKHAELTAEITNRMTPRYLAALTYTPVPRTALFRRYQTGEYQLPDPFETLEEMKVMFENIRIDNLTFIGSHASNYLPVSGKLQRDKGKMLETVNGILQSRNMDALRSDAMRGL